MKAKLITYDNRNGKILSSEKINYHDCFNTDPRIIEIDIPTGKKTINMAVHISVKELLNYL